jgi:hypothetical protein
MARHPDAGLLPVAATATAVAGALALAACGVSPEEAPREIAQELTTSTTSEVEAGTDMAPVELWFTRFSGPDGGSVLVPVEAEVVVGDSGAPTPGVVLEALFEGVPADLVEDDEYRSSIPAETTLSGPPEEPVDGELTVDFESGIDLQGSASRLAFGQMVCSVEVLAGIESVRFTRRGEPLEPVDGSGEASTGPLTCDDYDQLRH